MERWFEYPSTGISTCSMRSCILLFVIPNVLQVSLVICRKQWSKKLLEYREANERMSHQNGRFSVYEFSKTANNEGWLYFKCILTHLTTNSKHTHILIWEGVTPLFILQLGKSKICGLIIFSNSLFKKRKKRLNGELFE